jgi:hypothetical protein
VSATGYENASEPANVTDGGNAIVDFALTAKIVGPSVSVDSFAYSGSGGRNRDKHVSVTIALVDDLGAAVTGAAISVTITSNSGSVSTGSGTTGAGGTISFTWSNAPGDCYTTAVTSVTASGLTFDPSDPSSTSAETCKASF